MVNIFDGQNHYTFRDTQTAVDFLSYLSTKYKKGIEVWTANLQYDIGNTFRNTQENLSLMMAGSRIITAKVFQEKIKFKDILNVIPGSSVKTLGRMIKFEKLESNNNFDNELYCQVDTEIVYWALLKYKQTLSRLNIELKNTAAATGFNHLLKRYEALKYNSFDNADHEFLREGYYGGRTEVFNTAIQKGEIYGYDIVSSYPNVMRRIPLVDTFSKIYTTRPKLDQREGMMDCEVIAPHNLIVPYLPQRIDNKLCFPVGSFRGVWTYFEIREAKKLGYKIKKVHKAIEFKRNYDFSLKEFVEEIFKTRFKAKTENDTVLDYACKIILNASYGKFALGNEKTELIAFQELKKLKGDFCCEIFPNNQVLVKKVTNYNPATNYLTASLITAYARHELYNHLIQASKDNRTLLYCDTDSVFFKGKPLNYANQSNELGSLKLEHKLKECQFILPKTYYIKWLNDATLYKCKGVKNDLAMEFFTKGYAKWMSPLKYVETCRKNFQISERNKKNKGTTPFIPFNVWVEKPKSLKSKYDKRKINNNGTTSPIFLDLESN